MFFLRSGACEVSRRVIPNDTGGRGKVPPSQPLAVWRRLSQTVNPGEEAAPYQQYQTLGIVQSGGHFGETAIVQPGSRRTAMVTACTFCDVSTLHSDDYEELLASHPAAAGLLREKMALKLGKYARSNPKMDKTEKAPRASSAADGASGSGGSSESATSTGEQSSWARGSPRPKFASEVASEMMQGQSGAVATPEHQRLGMRLLQQHLMEHLAEQDTSAACEQPAGNATPAQATPVQVQTTEQAPVEDGSENQAAATALLGAVSLDGTQRLLPMAESDVMMPPSSVSSPSAAAKKVLLSSVLHAATPDAEGHIETTAHENRTTMARDPKHLHCCSELADERIARIVDARTLITENLILGAMDKLRRSLSQRGGGGFHRSRPLAVGDSASDQGD